MSVSLTRTLPASWYVDPSRYDAERRAIFGREWQLAGPVSAVAEPGDVLAVEAAGWPVLLAHGHDGRIRAFHNVCRHRAAPLLASGCRKSCARLRCPYHGWQYGLDGAFERAPGFGGEIDALQPGLHALRCETWRSFVFVNVWDEAPPLSGALRAFDEAAGHIEWEAFGFDRFETHEMRCNWKTYVENYLEGYHIPYLHPSLSKQVDVRGYEVRVGDRFVEHLVPTRVDGPTVAGFWVFLWPNVALNVYASGISVERIVPTGPQTTRLEYAYLFRDGMDAASQASEIAMSREVTREDITIVEAIQRNLAVGVYDRGWLSPEQERGVEAFQKWVQGSLET